MRRITLGPSTRNLIMLLGLGVAIQVTPRPLAGQMPAFSINPGRMEVEVKPGTGKTISFEINAANAVTPERGRLILSPTDWAILEDGSLTFARAGTAERSAAPWILFSPSATTLEAGRTQLVRITVSVPEKTQPGVYRTGLFVEERPPATPPDPSLRVINVRVRFVFVLYVIVPPVASHAELVNVEMGAGNGPPRLICEMKNTGNGHTRPLIFWSIRPNIGAAAEIAKGGVEATVLLPLATLKEPYVVQHEALAPGRYQVSVLVDFQDGRPQQSMARDFEVPEPAPAPAPAPAVTSEPAPVSPAVAPEPAPAKIPDDH
jgi:hypothetical protein